MADEPDNLVLRLLREIRGKLDEHDKRFDEHDKRFDRLDSKLDPMQFQLTHTFGLAGMANLQAQHTTERFEAAEDRQKAFEAAMAEMRRKMAELAAKFVP